MVYLYHSRFMWGVLCCRSDVTRDKFEELAAPILARAMKPCEDALVKAGITAADVSAVEMVGAASRTPAIVKTVAEVFKQEPKRCALAQGVMQSSYCGVEYMLCRIGLSRGLFYIPASMSIAVFSWVETCICSLHTVHLSLIHI